MYHQIIAAVEIAMAPHLSNEQLDILHDTLVQAMQELPSTTTVEETAPDLVQIFLSAKRVEGCSDKTVLYYDSTIRNVLNAVGKDVRDVTTDDLRIYLDRYQSTNGVSKVTIDNIRRILSSYFAWLEDEDYITKSPVRRIHKVKTCKTVKETYSDEALELMRAYAAPKRQLDR
ncbi:MAG: site-specific integrase [Eubacteriales bacterium]|nr:site-specific integrase [Eubacteriales bacterium]